MQRTRRRKEDSLNGGENGKTVLARRGAEARRKYREGEVVRESSRMEGPGGRVRRDDGE